MSGKCVIGLIGGIGSGKSQVATVFAQLLGKEAVRVVSGDEAGHEALRQPAVRARVLERWGTRLRDGQGEIDRGRLAAIVFADPVERRDLERLVHPWIEQRLHKEIEAARHDPRVQVILLDAAILLEAGWNKVCDLLVYVHAPRDVRLQRLARQRGWSAKEVAAREAAQWPLTEKVSRANGAVDNSGSLEVLRLQVAELLRQLRGENKETEETSASRRPA